MFCRARDDRRVLQQRHQDDDDGDEDHETRVIPGLLGRPGILRLAVGGISWIQEESRALKIG